ncbi:hypothetical protein BCR43DRAFT_528195 [Syncephalastrum racemosum]|uniref:Uncharacterized protein n=1 Tax=Syncephalastrum racemosum TaxID=13706 RepID=A0A1X2H0J6_SYNRA|nr:hypothetical protein BCR43DRAFT_528195 [Syncephalastrum racemosum]
MSASVAPPQLTLPIASKDEEDWLPLPGGLADTDDSFSRDLIRQFDKRRSRLHFELWGEEPSTRTSSSSRRADGDLQQLDHQDDDDEHDNDNVEAQRQSTHDNSEAHPASTEARRRSAGDLLRRSSAYLRTKFVGSFRRDVEPTPHQHQPAPDPSRRGITSLRRRPRPRAQDIFSNSSASLPPPSKIAINTTIAIPQFHPSRQHDWTLPSSRYVPVQPPVITQYPPKPLKYAPVEPISDNEPRNSNGYRKIMHRISLPVLNQNASPRAEERRMSTSDVHPAPEHTKHPWESIGRHAARLSRFFGCHPSRHSPRKGKERAEIT